MKTSSSPLLVEIRETPKGRGVFALGPIAEGTAVVVGKRLAESAQRTRYSLQMDYDLHVDLDEPGKLINHSCNPNMYPEENEFGGYTFVARRHIGVSEEVTFDYDMTEFFSIAVPECLCGTPQCRGKTRGLINLSQAKRQEYGNQVGNYARDWLISEDSSQGDSQGFDPHKLGKIGRSSQEYYRVLARAAENFRDHARILDLSSDGSLFCAWPLGARCSKYVLASLDKETLQLSAQWKNQGAPSSMDSFHDRSRSWMPHVLLALVGEGMIDPSAEALRLRHESLRTALVLCSAKKEDKQWRFEDFSGEGNVPKSFEVINIGNAGDVFDAASVQEWIEELRGLLSFLAPGGFLTVTLPSSTPNQKTTNGLERTSALTAGTCLEALQSEALGLSVVFDESLTVGQNESLTLVVLAQKTKETA